MRKGFALFFTIAVCFLTAYLVCFQMISKDVFPAVSSILFGKETFEIISAEPGTELQLVWAYEASVSETDHQKIDQYQHVRDISFKRITTDNNWTVSEEGLPRSETAGAKFSFSYPKYSNNVFVFCLRAVKGNVIVRHDYPGGHTFYRIEEANTDAIPLSSAVNSDFAWKIPRLFFTLLIGSCLAGICLIAVLRLLRKNPLIQPDPLPIPSVSISPGFYIIVFLLPVILGTIVCWKNQFAPFGNRSFLYNDMLNQNYKFILYLKNMPKENNDLFYSFSKVLGGNMFSLFSFYFSNPFYLLIFLFPERQIPSFCTYLILLHLGLAGTSSFVYLINNRRSKTGSVLFSCAYALMAYNIVCAENLHFLTDMVLFPIVMLGLERLIRNRRPKLYILFLTASLLLNVYFGYMICLFALIWFLFVEISENRKTFVSDFIDFLLYSFLAAGMAMAVILPFAASLTDGPKTFSLRSLQPEILLNIPQLLSKLFTSAFNHSEMEYGGPSLFCGTITTCFSILYFFQKSTARRFRNSALAVLVLFVLSFTVSSFYLIWHGFNYPIWWPSRFAFTFGFFLVYLASESFDNRKQVCSREIILSFLLFSVIGLIVYNGALPYISNQMLLLDMIIAGSCLVLLIPGIQKYSASGKIYSILAAILLFFDLCLNMAFIWDTNFEETYPETARTVNEYLREYELVYKPVEKLKNSDDRFYRVEYAMAIGENPGLLHSTNGLSHFSSTSGNDIRLFLDRIGFTSRYRLSANYRYGSTMTSDSLLGIKYLVSEAGLDKKPYPVLSQNPAITIQENPYAFSLGMGASPEILVEHLTENDIFHNQEKIISAILGNSTRLFTKAEGISLTTDNIEAYAQDNYVIQKLVDPGKPGIMSWSFTVNNQGMLYAYFPVLSQRTGFISLNGEPIGKTIDPDNYGVIPLGVFPSGTELTVTLEFSAESIALYEPLFVYEDTEILSLLSEEKIISIGEITKHSSSYLEYDIRALNNNEWLLLTIPYSDEWKIKINNEPVSAEKVFNALLAVPLDQGDNHIEMHYIPRGFLPGCGITLLSLFFFLMDLRKQKRPE